MTWLWISAPIAAIFFLGYTIIPIWLVFRHPDTGPAQAVRAQAGQPQARRPLAGSEAAVGTAAPRRQAAPAAAPQPAADVAVPQDWLVGAGR
jgi:hypothetical protein